MSKLKFIDDEKEYNEVLYQLNILDDDDDWPLFCKMRDKERYLEQNFEINFEINKEVESYIIKNELYIKAGYTRKIVQLLTLKETIKSKESKNLKESEKEVFHQIEMSDYLSIELMLKMNKELDIKTKDEIKNKKL